MDSEAVRARVLEQAGRVEELVAHSQAQRTAADCLLRAVNGAVGATLLRSRLELGPAVDADGQPECAAT